MIEARVAVSELAQALAAEQYAGWDPYDALAAPIVRACARTRSLRRVAIQALCRSPVNTRRLLGVPRLRHTKALALFVSAYVRLARREGSPDQAEVALHLAELLVGRALAVDGTLGWGYDFDVQTRWGYYRRGEPNAVVTTFAAHALLDAAELPAGERLAPLPCKALDFASSRLVVTRGRERFFAYVPGSTVPIHNANVLIASLAARCAQPNSQHWRHAEAAVAFTLARQRADGSWPYGEGERLGWIDGFHTAYVLDALAQWHSHSDDLAVADALDRGLDLYLTRLIDPDGAPRASVRSRYPIDVHAGATAISTLARLASRDPRAFRMATKVLRWTLRWMRRPDGRFAFRRHRVLRNNVPYVRWSDAHMLLALADYLEAEERYAGA